MTALDLDRVSHAYEDLLAVDEVSLSIAKGEVVSLLGPSGCGKTTVLRVAAGLERLQSGRISMGGRTVPGNGKDVPPEERSVGLVFQDYALFPHLRVLENVEFGLRDVRGQERRERALAALERVGMASYAEAYPHMLSGGQQQRVAIARALAPRPRVVLMDEPFSGLDTRLRGEIRDQALHLLKESGAAALLVTHDPEEAMFMSDRIALMREGRVVQAGPPVDLYFRPADSFTASFFGEINHLAAAVQDGRVATALGDFPARGFGDGTPVEVLIRPEAIRLLPAGEHAGSGRVPAAVQAARLLGRTSLVHLSLAGGGMGPVHLHARVPGRFLPTEGEVFNIDLDPAHCFVFAREKGRMMA